MLFICKIEAQIRFMEMLKTNTNYVYHIEFSSVAGLAFLKAFSFLFIS